MARAKTLRVDKGIRIFRRNDSRVWQIEIRRRGRKRERYSLNVTDQEAALAEAKQLARDIHEGRTGVVKQQDGTYAQMLEAYRKHADLRNTDGTRDLNYANLARISDWVKSHLGVDTLHGSDFTPDLIERYMMSRKQAGKSPDTINRERGSLSSLFEICRKKGLVRANVAELVQPLPSPRKRIPKTMEAEDIRRLLEAAGAPVELHGRGGIGQGNTRARLTPIRDLVFFVLNTGARQGEAIFLEWNDVDFRGGHVQFINKPEHKMKAGNERAIKMNSAVIRLLRKRKIAAGGTRWVFPSTTGKPLDSGNVYREVQNAIQRAKLQNKKIDFNILRHCFLTAAAQEGVPPFVLKELAGHASIRTTENYYIGGVGAKNWTPPEVGVAK